MALITSIYMCGLFLGSLICSTSDRFGRKAVLMVSWAIAVVSGVGNAFVKSYVGFCVLRFFTGAGENSSFKKPLLCKKSFLQVRWDCS